MDKLKNAAQQLCKELIRCIRAVDAVPRRFVAY